MLALTLKHPWPWAITTLGKDLENRSWAPGNRLKPGDWFAIHGGREPTGELERFGVAQLAQDLARRQGQPPLRHLAPFQTGLVAVCRFGGVVRSSRSVWFDQGCGGYGWVLDDVRALPEPVPCRGAQGLWPIPEPVLARVHAQFPHLGAGR